MSVWRALLIVLAGIAVVVGGFALLTHHANVPLLEPQGSVGLRQRNLIYFALGLALIVIIPVYVMIIVFATRYREGRPAATTKYQPDWDHNRTIETVWWAIPIALITILSVVAWVSSHTLDPYRPLASDKPPLRVQVVALQWRWLFIYPEQGVASVNYLQIPVDRPVNFEITADAPMNSFWIPQLGGQVYAMAGMVTQLHLEADKPGDYRGVSANISGTGFAGMHFAVRADSEHALNAWVATAKQSSSSLTFDNYERLAKPSQDDQVMTFGSSQPDLFEAVRNKFMSHSHGTVSLRSVAGSEGAAS